MIYLIQSAHWAVLTAIWILVGTLWTDFLSLFQRKYVKNVKFGTFARAVNTIIWPLSIVFFIWGVIEGIIRFYTKR